MRLYITLLSLALLSTAHFCEAHPSSSSKSRIEQRNPQTLYEHFSNISLIEICRDVAPLVRKRFAEKEVKKEIKQLLNQKEEGEEQYKVAQNMLFYLIVCEETSDEVVLGQAFDVWRDTNMSVSPVIGAVGARPLPFFRDRYIAFLETVVDKPFPKENESFIQFNMRFILMGNALSNLKRHGHKVPTELLKDLERTLLEQQKEPHSHTETSLNIVRDMLNEQATEKGSDDQ